MIHIITLLLVLFATSTPLETSQGEKAQVRDATSQALIDLENKWVEALAKSDTASLESILDNTYVDTDEQGHRADKQGLLSVLKSGDLKVESLTISDMHVHVYGDAAVVTGNAQQKGSFKGQPLTEKVVFTDTFVKRNGKWKAVASQRSPAS